MSNVKADGDYSNICHVHSGYLFPLESFLSTSVYRVSQEERAKLRESVPYVKIYPI